MIKLAIYDDDPHLVQCLHNDLLDYVASQQLMMRIDTFDSSSKLCEAAYAYDIYILDILHDTVPVGLELAKTIKEKVPKAKIIFVCEDGEYLLQSYTLEPFMYLLKPLRKEMLYATLDKVRQRIRTETIIIDTPLGQRRLLVEDLLYVDISKRCLCYHMKSGELYNGQTMRTSFEMAIRHLKDREHLLFLNPSLLINLAEIELLNKDHAIFYNGTKVYFARTNYEKIQTAWAQM